MVIFDKISFTSGLVHQRIGMSPRKTVMICDDEADLLYLFRSALEPAYNVVAAESGKSCIEKIY
jgi:hypothetical protein